MVPVILSLFIVQNVKSHRYPIAVLLGWVNGDIEVHLVNILLAFPGVLASLDVVCIRPFGKQRDAVVLVQVVGVLGVAVLKEFVVAELGLGDSIDIDVGDINASVLEEPVMQHIREHVDGQVTVRFHLQTVGLVLLEHLFQLLKRRANERTSPLAIHECLI